MSTQWILLANASVARLFRRESPTDALVPLTTMEHPQSRLKGTQLADDRPGHHATDSSPGGNRYEPRADARRKEHQHFAAEIAKHLDTALAAGEFSSLWILASSPFLGEINAQLTPAVSRHVLLAVDTDLTSLGLAELEQRLADPRLGKA